MFIYNLVILLYGFVIRVSSLNKIKAKQWVEGRKNWREKLKAAAKNLEGTKKIWVHCASYGEFEQGRPLIDEIKQRQPNVKIILSFFSPSGYEAFKDWKGADLVCYLPLDTSANAADFLEITKPDSVIFIKYEFWLNFLEELRKRKIKTYLVSAVFKPHHPFFRWYGSIFKHSLKAFTTLFVQDKNSAQLLNGIGVKNVEICGDTRFDRVLEVKEKRKQIPLVEEFCTNAKVIVAGSTWPKDNEFLLNVFRQMDASVKMIIAPHEVDKNSIDEVENLLKRENISYSLYSSRKINKDAQVFVLDTIGLLSSTYHYGNVAYIGGGFNEGWHNILEASVYSIPVALYGEDQGKFNEITELIKLGAAQNFLNERDLVNWYTKFLKEETAGAEVQKILKEYFSERGNVSEKVLAKMSI
jgi:3-deoxy-D-manno-octulosonic-acid transferase